MLKARRKLGLPWRNSIGFIAIRFTPSSAAVATAAKMRRTSHRIFSSTCWRRAPWDGPSPNGAGSATFCWVHWIISYQRRRTRWRRETGWRLPVGVLDDDTVEDRYQL